MKDQSGLPIWDKMITVKRPETANKGENGDGSEEYIIPLTENEKNLSSILFVTKYSDSSFAFKNVDNEKLKRDVFNPQLDKNYREQILLNFIVTDHLSFSKDAVYWNIPDDLLTFVPRDVTNPQGKFQIRTPVSNSGGSTANLNDTCVSWVTNCTCNGSNCDLCNNGGQCVTHSVCLNGGGDGGYGGYEGGPEGDAGYPGDPGTGGPPGDGGSGDGGGSGNPGGGNPDGNGDDCGGPNKAFYKIVPGCDDDGGENGELTPCEKIKTVGKNTKTQQLLGTLKTKTNSTKEFGYVLSENSGTVSETPFEGITGEAAIRFPVNGPIDGLIHSHYTGLLSVFSVSDMFALAQIYKQGNIKNPYTFVIGVVTASNTQYLMVIDDPDMFGAFAENLFTGNQIDRKMQNLYELVYESYGIKTNNTAIKNESAFLSYLQTNHTGLKLLKGNSTFSNWSLLDKNSNGTVTSQNCP